MNTPEEGEEYQHVNTQLFGHIDPPTNRGVQAEHMAAPYNAPAAQRPTMSGFVADYISAFTAEMGHQPTYDEYSQIMTGYTPEQMPVLSAHARGFATFDHWYAEVPSQTFTNRSFFHAATASGFVVNAPYANFPVYNDAETLFERLESAGLTWRVYCDPPSPAPFTGLIHGPRLQNRFATNFETADHFYADVANGALPTYSFIEPNNRAHRVDRRRQCGKCRVWSHLDLGEAFERTNLDLGGHTRRVAGSGPTARSTSGAPVCHRL